MWEDLSIVADSIATEHDDTTGSVVVPADTIWTTSRRTPLCRIPPPHPTSSLLAQWHRKIHEHCEDGGAGANVRTP